jgi:hypothetical protein
MVSEVQVPAFLEDFEGIESSSKAFVLAFRCQT